MARTKKAELTPKQKKFAQLRAEGNTLKDSYYGAGYSRGNSEENARFRGREVARNPKVKAEIDRLQRLAEKKMILSQEQRGVLLTEMAIDKEAANADRVRAVDVLNKMTGVYNGMMVGVAVSIDDKRAAVLAALQEADL